MPERSFFDSRYAFPGYTFILVVVASNTDKLGFASIGTNPAVPLLLGLLALVNGAPLGFLISQPWYDFSKRFVFSKSRYIRLLKETYPKQVHTLREWRMIADYLAVKSTDENLKEYVHRRWDLVNLLGSTLTAIGFAIPSAFVVRYLASLELGNDWIEIGAARPDYQIATHWFSLSVGFAGFLLVIVASTAAIFFLVAGFRSARQEHELGSCRLLKEHIGANRDGWVAVFDDLVNPSSRYDVLVPGKEQ